MSDTVFVLSRGDDLAPDCHPRLRSRLAAGVLLAIERRAV